MVLGESGLKVMRYFQFCGKLVNENRYIFRESNVIFSPVSILSEGPLIKERSKLHFIKATLTDEPW